MRAVVRSVIVVALLAGCSGSNADTDSASADTLTRAQRDSVIGASSLPGAGGVRRALEVADSAAVRAARMDTLPLN